MLRENSASSIWARSLRQWIRWWDHRRHHFPPCSARRSISARQSQALLTFIPRIRESFHRSSKTDLSKFHSDCRSTIWWTPHWCSCIRLILRNQFTRPLWHSRWAEALSQRQVQHQRRQRQVRHQRQRRLLQCSLRLAWIWACSRRWECPKADMVCSHRWECLWDTACSRRWECPWDMACQM